MTIMGMGRGSNSLTQYAKVMLRRIHDGETSKAASVAVAGFDDAPLQPKDESKYTALSLTLSLVVPMAVKAVLELRIPDILAIADGGQPLSAPQILAKLPTKSTPGSTSFSNLRRLMRPLVQQGIFTETLNNEKQPAYGLTEVSKWWVRDNELSLAPFADLMLTRTWQDAFRPLHETILDDDANPFQVEHGMYIYEYSKKHPEFKGVFDKAMSSLTLPDVKEVADTLQDSGWLDGVKTFVDVGGGGAGNVARAVVARNPHIQGINFDLPHVVEGAPETTGVRFVGGDFMKAVPSGDAMITKYCVHNHDDDRCVTILKNCFEALPKGGKMIIAETLIKDLDSSPKASSVAAMDLVVLGIAKGGRERTKDECQQLLEAAGFSQIAMIPSQTSMDLILGVKE